MASSQKNVAGIIIFNKVKLMMVLLNLDLARIWSRMFILFLFRLWWRFHCLVWFGL